MHMNPPTLPADYVPAVHADELVRTLELIWHATAPTPDDGGHHEAAHDLADAALKKIEARRLYEAKHLPSPAPLVPIDPNARAGKLPCAECHIRPGERCDICGAVGA